MSPRVSLNIKPGHFSFQFHWTKEKDGTLPVHSGTMSDLVMYCLLCSKYPNRFNLEARGLLLCYEDFMSGLEFLDVLKSVYVCSSFPLTHFINRANALKLARMQYFALQCCH